MRVENDLLMRPRFIKIKIHKIEVVISDFEIQFMWVKPTMKRLRWL